MNELKPCPFCGAEMPTITIRIFKGQDGWRDRYAILCRYDEGGCGAESGLYHCESEAVEAWNRRADECVVTDGGKGKDAEYKRNIRCLAECTYPRKN